MNQNTFDPTKLNTEDIVVGGGEEVKSGDSVRVHYTGWLLDGTKFDSSVDRGQPFSFVVGAGYVIQGWDQGLLGMKVGGKRKLTIPPSLGYGASGVPGTIPANAILIFEVELLQIAS
ncbi:MAG: peptidylprolyl isomerase [Parcubacteria group bacterium CG10_big_fil_rev_8_21_14_0_10_36_14]|nr:MAG: peptidylprolyl isomerase [Parcubacteria group bacterium CG10_big_fil_rev_8_21_14_0_10_36_14]